MEDMVTAPTAAYVAPKTFQYKPPPGEPDAERRLNAWKGAPEPGEERRDSAKYAEAMEQKRFHSDKGLVTTFHAPVLQPLISVREREEKRAAPENPKSYELVTESKAAVSEWEAARDARAEADAKATAKRKAKRDKKKGGKKARGGAAAAEAGGSGDAPDADGQPAPRWPARAAAAVEQDLKDAEIKAAVTERQEAEASAKAKALAEAASAKAAKAEALRARYGNAGTEPEAAP